MTLAEKYNLRVPRYTSYPTAPHFSPALTGDTYRQWLGEIAAEQSLSLYLHIPFCDSMCWFCGCYTKVVQRYEPISDYLRALNAEIETVANQLPQRMRVGHVHWGGGSPSLLLPDDWMALIEHLRSAFFVKDDAEIAIELDPRETTEDYVRALAAAGVNRVSIGVQDFDAEVQAKINRLQPFEVVARVCDWLREHRIDHINLDLMYGLPLQTVARVEAMVDRAVSLAPRRIALFGYAHVPWMKTHQKLIVEASLPGASERLAQLSSASARLRRQGYEPVGLDHFALPDDDLTQALAAGRLKRNFQGYTTDTEPVLIGLGASAIGSLPQGYVQNGLPLKAYQETVLAGGLATVRGLALSADDRLRREIIERLMCDLTVDLEIVCRRHQRPIATVEYDQSRLADLADDGLATIDGSMIAITEKGRPFARLIAACFDSYLRTDAKPETARHSRAV